MRHLVVLAFCAALAASCNQYRGAYVTVWIADNPEVPRHFLVDGCRSWEGFGLTCDPVTYRGDADITVEFSDEPCASPLADAYTLDAGYSHIRVWTRCFVGKDGHVQGQGIKLVFAHEIGHALGLQHVPSSCDIDAYVWERDNVDPEMKLRRHPNGRIVCGAALMNPAGWHAETDGPTDVDAMEFDLRDRVKAVLMPDYPGLTDDPPVIPDARSGD